MLHFRVVPTLPARTFKTVWFAKAASKAKITDAALCRAIREVMKGQADDLGGGVFKKRLNDKRHRSIILAKGGQHWVYQGGEKVTLRAPFSGDADFFEANFAE